MPYLQLDLNGHYTVAIKYQLAGKMSAAYARMMLAFLVGSRSRGAHRKEQYAKWRWSAVAVAKLETFASR